jgi:TRAP-type mannitol/chloroaromatic compound transport system permease small subunit
MQPLLKLSRAIDWLNVQVGKYVIWLIFASTVISAINATVRKVFNTSSNAYLEVQWYLFAGAFLLAAGYTLLNGEHVRIDVPFFLNGFTSGEMSSNPGGLIRWPVYLMMPLGFALLLLQGWSELIKRIAFLMGLIEDPTVKKVAKSAEEELAESIRLAAEREGKL